jgi:hypothetical protein
VETGWEGVDWMQLVQNRDQWWVLGNTVMSLHVLWKTGILLAEWLLASQEGLCSLELLS